MKVNMIMIAVLSATLTTAGMANPASYKPKAAVSVQQNDSATFKVYGKCGMCRKRIEKAAKELDGVNSASWDNRSQDLTVEYDASEISEKEIHEKIAAAGHDTENVKATNEAYRELPGCCKYDRPENSNNPKK